MMKDRAFPSKACHAYSNPFFGLTRRGASRDPVPALASRLPRRSLNVMAANSRYRTGRPRDFDRKYVFQRVLSERIGSRRSGCSASPADRPDYLFDLRFLAVDGWIGAKQWPLHRAAADAG